ncbi:RING-H2 finger protein ATL74-like [Actinidia eriantha]|uniref:RING-H2 finger protein ATL74-like n=1 Tax=Actinidia eriantha TaxID=165200 RepID=UPI00258B58F7|nr:RING-H2 finger protein ATL74-like [Actinidia eriantha]
MVMAIAFSVILLFVGVSVLVLVHVCIIKMAFGRGFLDSNGNTIERGSFGSTSMSQDDVEKLPCFDFKAREKGSSPVDCAVCLESFKAGDKCRFLPLCRHSFHAQCVDLWLLKTPICPICRASADAGKGGSVSGEESSNSIGIGIEFGDSQATESGRFNELAVELRESQTAVSETDHLSDPGVRMRESQTLEGTT